MITAIGGLLVGLMLTALLALHILRDDLPHLRDRLRAIVRRTSEEN